MNAFHFIDGRWVEGNPPLMVVWDHGAWLGAAVKGRGEAPDEPATSLVLDVAGSRDATLNVLGQDVSLGTVLERGTAASADGQVRVELLTPDRAWLSCKIVDAATGLVAEGKTEMARMKGLQPWPAGAHAAALTRGRARATA